MTKILPNDRQPEPTRCSVAQMSIFGIIRSGPCFSVQPNIRIYTHQFPMAATQTVENLRRGVADVVKNAVRKLLPLRIGHFLQQPPTIDSNRMNGESQCSNYGGPQPVTGTDARSKQNVVLIIAHNRQIIMTGAHLKHQSGVRRKKLNL